MTFSSPDCEMRDFVFILLRSSINAFEEKERDADQKIGATDGQPQIVRKWLDETPKTKERKVYMINGYASMTRLTSV